LAKNINRNNSPTKVKTAKIKDQRSKIKEQKAENRKQKTENRKPIRPTGQTVV
jgi:hypothetical protein